MANEPLALAIRPPDAPNEDEFLTLCAALSASGRGRAFLAEYTRRNRNADTEALLVAIGRLEDRLRADASAVQRLRDDLRMLLIAVRLARPEIDAAGPPARAAKLSKLLDLLEQRLDAMAGGKAADTAPSHLSVVPRLDEPELPIPSPASAQAPAIALVHDPEKWEPVFGPDHAQPNIVPMTETMPLVAVAETALRAAIEKPAVVPAAPRLDPLAAIMALSEDERLALFT
jgi:hypothetical protein